MGTFLVVQWLRMHLPTQVIWVQSLVQGDPVLCNKRGHRNEKPMHHNPEKPALAITRESL